MTRIDIGERNGQDPTQVMKGLLVNRNILLMRGMGGVGKTTLLRHFGERSQTDGFVDRAIYFEYDDRAWTLEQILFEIAKVLITDAEEVSTFPKWDDELHTRISPGTPGRVWRESGDESIPPELPK